MLPSAVHLQTRVWRKCRDYSENCAVPCLNSCKAYSYLRSLGINIAFKVKYILKFFPQERWLKPIGIEKVLFPHHSQLLCTKPSDFMVDWLLDGKIYWGVSLALDKKRVALRQHFGDCQLSPILLEGKFSGEGMHRKEVGKLRTAAAQLSVWWCKSRMRRRRKAMPDPTQNRDIHPREQRGAELSQ